MKTNHSGRKTLVKKLQDNDVPQIVQINGQKHLQSINNYSRSLRERQMENISKILSSSSSTNAVLPAAQQSLQSHFTEAHSSTSTAENTLQTMFQGVFNINLSPTKNTVTSPELGPKAKKK